MRASGSLLWLYLFIHSNGSQKLFEEHGHVGSKCIRCSRLRFLLFLFYLHINLVYHLFLTRYTGKGGDFS